MSSYECNYRCSCTLIALIASAFIGVITAFLQITGVITVATPFLWVTFGIAVGFLAVLSATAQFKHSVCQHDRLSLHAQIAGILGTVLLSVTLLAVGITATSVVSAVLVGILLFFFSLTLTGTACAINCLADYAD